MKLKTSLILFFIFGFIFESCIVIKNEAPKQQAPRINLSPKPEIPMSDNLVRSKQGDMIAFLPEGWFFLDLTESTSADIIAFAVNPDYTIGAVFSTVRTNELSNKDIDKEGLMGLARLSFDHHQRKSGGSVNLIGKFTNVDVGTNNFVKYEFGTAESQLPTLAAVFVSSMKQNYQFTLIPMKINGKPLPTRPDMDLYFNSILRTIQY